MDKKLIFMNVINVKDQYNLKNDLFKILCHECKNIYYDKCCFLRHFKIEHLGWKKCKKCGAVVKDLNIHIIDYCQKKRNKKEKEKKSIIYKDFLKRKRKVEGEIILDSYILKGKENKNMMRKTNNNMSIKMECKLIYNKDINKEKSKFISEKKLDVEKQQKMNIKYVEAGVEAKLIDLNEIESKNSIENNNSFTYLKSEKMNKEVGVQVNINKIGFIVKKESFSYNIMSQPIKKNNNAKNMMTNIYNNYNFKNTYLIILFLFQFLLIIYFRKCYNNIALFSN